MEAAVYCLKGHFVGILNEVIRGRSWHQAKIFLENPREPEQLPPFCSKCGAKNISVCQQCQKAIEKQYSSADSAESERRSGGKVNAIPG